MESLSYLLGAVLGGLVAGSLCGLVPFSLAKKRGRKGLGIAALITCAASGVILGLLLALPVAASFSVAIIITSNSSTQS